MSENSALTRKQLNTPKAAAIAGIAFSVLLMAILWLLRRSVPDDPLDSGAWIATESGTVVIALNLIPLAGVAFLWFIGVLRDRLGQQEDRFFATVFLGSGLLFLAMLFAAAAIAGAVMLLASSAGPDQLDNSPTFHFARATVYIIANAYAAKMACVFMISTSTVVNTHRDSSALDCHPGVCPRLRSFGWQLLPELEYRGFSDLGLPAQHSHPDPQSSRTAGR